jgi:hypothetical protein
VNVVRLVVLVPEDLSPRFHERRGGRNGKPQSRRRAHKSKDYRDEPGDHPCGFLGTCESLEALGSA